LTAAAFLLCNRREGGDDATTLGIAGFVISLEDHCPTALALFDRALALSSNAFPLCFSALTLSWMGKSELAIERAQRALRLNPFDSLNHLSYGRLSATDFLSSIAARFLRPR
jgi:tetratricopeptide (TPR) repeat protein